MRKWSCNGSASGPGRHAHVLAGLIHQLGQPRFPAALLETLQPLVPAASFSVYRTGRHSVPQLFFSGSIGVPDTTRACWHAYLAGPYRNDRTLMNDAPDGELPLLCHHTAREVPAQHRASVYDAHGVSERVSVVQVRRDGLFAFNLYRHQHQAPFSDAQVGEFETLAPALLALACQQITLGAVPAVAAPVESSMQERLLELQPALTPREVEVCTRLLQGMTFDGIACDLGLGVPSVKTYRNRAFERLGIHFRNELFALMLRAPARLHQPSHR
ncbi:MAG: helix-turn-helix transcriptional regulator [Burkholderiaceae bacterium]